jgi:pilus assembly protein Flp/PilA
MIKLLKTIKSDKSGASAAEYALMLAVLGAVVVGAITGLADSIGGSLTAASTTLEANQAGQGE